MMALNINSGTYNNYNSNDNFVLNTSANPLLSVEAHVKYDRETLIRLPRKGDKEYFNLRVLDSFLELHQETLVAITYLAR